MFCAPTLVFGDINGVGSRFNVLRVQTHFLRYRGHSVPFSCFTSLDSFSAVPSASDPVLKYCESGHFFCGTEGVLSLFHVLRARTRFRRYRVRRVPLSCFAGSDSFLAVPRASGPVFMFSAFRLVIAVAEGIRSHFNVLRVWTHFLRYGGHSVPFSCFASPDSFSAVLRALGPSFMFCAPVLVFSSTEGVRARFHVLLFRTHFQQYRSR
jgi:hypothetical protein